MKPGDLIIATQQHDVASDYVIIEGQRGRFVGASGKDHIIVKLPDGQRAALPASCWRPARAFEVLNNALDNLDGAGHTNLQDLRDDLQRSRDAD